MCHDHRFLDLYEHGLHELQHDLIDRICISAFSDQRISEFDQTVHNDPDFIIGESSPDSASHRAPPFVLSVSALQFQHKRADASLQICDSCNAPHGCRFYLAALRYPYRKGRRSRQKTSLRKSHKRADDTFRIRRNTEKTLSEKLGAAQVPNFVPRLSRYRLRNALKPAERKNPLNLREMRIFRGFSSLS